MPFGYTGPEPVQLMKEAAFTENSPRPREFAAYREPAQYVEEVTFQLVQQKLAEYPEEGIPLRD